MNKYGPILYDDIDEDLYVFALFEKSMKRLTHFVPRPRSDHILCEKSIDQQEILRNLYIGKDVDDNLR